jgi:hypothetical protein
MKLIASVTFLTTLAIASPLQISKLADEPKFETVPRYRGACPDIKGTDKWDPVVYTSHNWWQPISSPFFWNFPGTTCISATYEPTGQISSTGGVYFSVLNQGILPDQTQEKTGNQYEVANGMAVQNTAYNGTASVIFYQGVPSTEGTNYIVMDTDNESYAYVWSAGNAGNSCRPILWMLFGDRDISESSLAGHIESAMNIIKSSGWKWAYDFEKTLEYWPSVGCPDVPDSPYN